MLRTLVRIAFVTCALGKVLYEGRAPLTLTGSDLDASSGPYLTVVKGSTQNATHYDTLLGRSVTPTQLWAKNLIPFLNIPILKVSTQQAISVTIDNSSVFVPGGNPQFGFRRTELIARGPAGNSALNLLIEAGVTVFHFSIKLDDKHPLNYNHEYQIVFIEPNDGTHVFGVQLGSPFTNPTGVLPAKNARSFKVLDHALNILFSTPFSEGHWHNFAVQVDWNQRTLAVLYSVDDDVLRPVSKVVSNPTTASGTAGQGDFHFGVLKLPIVNQADIPADQGDVVHHGIQEGTTEGLIYSGVFVEDVSDGISVGNGRVISQIA